jgi:DNA-binding HxlR family transcriptional regulator
LTIHTPQKVGPACPAEALLKQLSGKWKPQIFRLAVNSPLRFSTLLREIEGTNKQSLASSLNELVEAGYLDKVVIRQKPLHIEYSLSAKGRAVVPLFMKLELL